jgi:hypothetical protein
VEPQRAEAEKLPPPGQTGGSRGAEGGPGGETSWRGHEVAGQDLRPRNGGLRKGAAVAGEEKAVTSGRLRWEDTLRCAGKH